jgi:large subunit ribosomal protein L25
VETLSLELHERQLAGKVEARKLRKNGSVPCVVYTRGKPSLHATVAEREFRRLAEKSLATQVFEISSPSEVLSGKKLIVRDIQTDHLKGDLIHVEFQSLEPGIAVKLAVPLDVQGEPRGVKIDGGILAVQSRDVLVQADPESIPSSISVDVTDLGLGETIHSRDLKLPTGVSLVGTGDQTIANVVSSRKTKLAESAATPGAAEGGEAAKAAAPEAKKPEAKK